MPVAGALTSGLNAGTSFGGLQQQRRRDAFDQQQKQVENYASIVGELGTTLKSAKEQFEAKLATTSDLPGKQKILGEWKQFYEGTVSNASRAGQTAASRGIPVDPVAQVARLTQFENLRDLAAEQALAGTQAATAAGQKATAQVPAAVSAAQQKSEIETSSDSEFFTSKNGDLIEIRKDGATVNRGQLSKLASTENITTTALTKPNTTNQQANEIGATQSALEARELSEKITASDVGLRGIGNVFMAETIGQIFDSAVDEDVLNNRQAALALKEKTLKSMSDDKRFSNLDRQALEKLFVSMGAFESVKSAKTKLLGLADILEQRASFSAGLLGHKPLHELRQDELVAGMKDGTIDFATGRRALVNYHGFGE